MDGYLASTYGDAWADHYDTLFDPPGEELGRFVAERAGGGPVLELAVGTGRIALELRRIGLEVHGIEVSQGMLNRLRSRPGGDEIRIVAADMRDFAVPELYPLVLLAFNTLFAVQEAAGQAGVFRSVAAALEPGGVFVVEAFVPDLDRFDRGQTVRVRHLFVDRVVLEYSIHHPEDQRVDSIHEIRNADGTTVMLPVPTRYLFPRQIDDLAAAAGLELVERHSWYDETPFTDDSASHVSVYRNRGGEGRAE